MSFNPKIKSKIIAVLFAILPAFAVGFLVFGADVYYDLDSNTIKTYENSEITGNHPYLAYRQAGLAKHTPSASQPPLLRREYIKETSIKEVSLSADFANFSVVNHLDNSITDEKCLSTPFTNKAAPVDRTGFEPVFPQVINHGACQLAERPTELGLLDCDYNIENNFNQNKNTFTESEDVFGTFGIKVPASDKYCQCSISENLVKFFSVDNSSFANKAENALRWSFLAHKGESPDTPQAPLINNSIDDNKNLVNPVPNFTEKYDANKLSQANGIVNVDKQDCKIWNGVKSGQWIKVRELREGQMIAVTHGDKVVWERITKIKQQAPERVYDIEVQGTHNFIANGIVAHNTYINTSSTTALHVEDSGTHDDVFDA